jgi:hypothetical protein
MKRKAGTMGPFQYVNRSTYAWSAALILLGVPVLLAAVVALLVPEAVEFASHVNKACTIVLALLTGGRLADAGYQYWVGAVPVLVIGVALPAIAGAALILLEINQEQIGIAGSGSIHLLLVLFCVWAGTRKPVPRPGPENGLGGKRIESRRPTGPRL